MCLFNFELHFIQHCVENYSTQVLKEVGDGEITFKYGTKVITIDDTNDWKNIFYDGLDWIIFEFLPQWSCEEQMKALNYWVQNNSTDELEQLMTPVFFKKIARLWSIQIWDKAIDEEIDKLLTLEHFFDCLRRNHAYLSMNERDLNEWLVLLFEIFIIGDYRIKDEKEEDMFHMSQMLGLKNKWNYDSLWSPIIDGVFNKIYLFVDDNTNREFDDIRIYLSDRLNIFEFRDNFEGSLQAASEFANLSLELLGLEPIDAYSAAENESE